MYNTLLKFSMEMNVSWICVYAETLGIIDIQLI